MPPDEIQRIYEELAELRDGQKEIMKILSGNGGVGLCEKIRVLEATAERRRQQPNQWRAWIAVGISLAVAVVSVLKHTGVF